MAGRIARGRALARLFPFAFLTVFTGGAAADPSAIAAVAERFAASPDEARALVRWWWFGPAVVEPQLEREMVAMKAGGFRGFEIQPVYPMALDDPARGIRNLPYLSTGFLDAVGFVNDRAHRPGLRIDMTLAGGWPYGGPNVPVIEKAWAGLLRNVYADGRFGGVQQTGAEPAYYRPASSYTYGVGGFLLAAAELKKMTTP